MRTASVDVQRASADFDAEGKHYAKGSYIVLLGQPYGGFAKTLLEIQHYPDLREYPGGPPQRQYDVTAQTLPLLLDVNVVAVQDKFSAPGVNVIGSSVRPAILSGRLRQPDI